VAGGRRSKDERKHNILDPLLSMNSQLRDEKRSIEYTMAGKHRHAQEKLEKPGKSSMMMLWLLQKQRGKQYRGRRGNK
jgi:hypothetical protein